MVYEVMLTRRAARQMTRSVTWWRENREKSPDLLENELLAVFESLAHFPERGLALREVQLRASRYLITQRTQFLIMYRVRPRLGRVEILTITDGQRGDRPW